MTNSAELEAPVYRPRLALYAKVLVVATLFLIFMGGQVKSHEAGLAVPDWPTTYGENMLTFHYSKWTGGIFHEHVHRLIAFVVALMTAGLLVWVLRKESRSWVKTLAIVTSAMVILQAGLGGLTVILHLPAWTSVSHGVLAQTFFMMTILVAYAVSREWHVREPNERDVESSPVLKPALWMAGIVYVQLILGAVMRHTESGLALPDFPTMAGQWLPVFTQSSVDWVNNWRLNYSLDTGAALEDVTMGQMYAHLLHRAGAIAVLAALFLLARHAKRVRDAYPQVWKTCVVLMALVTVQVVLGILTVMTHRVPLITSLHVVTGAATLGVSWLCVLRAVPLSYFEETTTTVSEGPASSGDSLGEPVVK